jgi:2,5-diketo-D-gluconate reductase B
MEFVDIKCGVRAPVLGLGTARLRGSECVKSVRMAVDLGYRHIDTAELYANEREIGEAIATAGVERAEIFLTTKIWTNHFRAADTRRAVETSLRNLRTDYVDLLLMHSPNLSVPLAETLGVLASLLEAGKARAIGVSNFPVSLLEKAISACPAPISCDQVKYHVGCDQGPLLAFARPRGIVITAYSPLGLGSLPHHPVLKDIARKHGKNPGQIALRWLIEQDGVMAIPKATTERNLRANIDIFDFALDDQDRARLDKARSPGLFARIATLRRFIRGLRSKKIL